MSKNTKHKFYKEYLELLRRQSDLYDIRNALGYEKLDKPYQHGFNAYLVLREDIARRKDADVYQYLVDNFTTRTWSKDGIFYRTYKKYHSDNRPKFKLISEDEYLKLEPKYKKFFHHVEKEDRKYWNGTILKYYRCYFEPHYLVMEIEKSFITHKKVIDGNVERDLKFVNDKINHLNTIINPYFEGFVQYAKRYQTKQLRRRDKINLKKNLNHHKFTWFGDEVYPLSEKRETGYWW